MAEIPLPILAASPDPTAANAPTVGFNSGSNRPYLALDAATDQRAVWTLRLPDNFSSGGELNIQWGADTATSGDVVLTAEVMALTPNTDTADAETDSYDTVNSVTDTHLGTTAGRLHEATITLTNADSMAAGDYIAIRIARDADNASDTLAGDVFIHAVSLEYTES
jgi:hypothetical protein